MKILKIKCNKNRYYDNNCFEMDFTTSKRVYEEDKEENIVSNIVNSIYKFNSISLVGINASGKTTTLNIISDIIGLYIDNTSLKFDMKLARYFDDCIELESYIYDDKEHSIYKIVSHVKKEPKMEMLFFEEEILYKKKLNHSVTNKNVFDFSEDHKIMVRTEVQNPFLKHDDSIFSSILNKNEKKGPLLMDMTFATNINLLHAFSSDMPMSFINYLDSSIEKFELIKHEDTPSRFKIKFKSAPKEIISDYVDLDKYLSSGTIKGINILIQVMVTLKTGGYLIIDEIENHLNKTIVMNLIDLFNNELNKNSATLVFSTHYSEILDSIKRSDSIYVLEKREDIHLKRYSDIAKNYDRPDRKKSDVILSGVLSPAPSYHAYKELKLSLNKRIEGEI